MVVLSSDRALSYRPPFAKFLRSLRLPIPTILDLEAPFCQIEKRRKSARLRIDRPRVETSMVGSIWGC